MRRLGTRVSGLLTLHLVYLATAQAAVPTTEQRGKLDTVTVYRGQALVTRLVDVAGAAGLHEVVVTDLPAQLLSASIFAEGGEGLVVRSVRYRERPVEADIREEVRALDTKIRDLQDSLAANAKQRELQVEQRSYLEKLELFTAPTANLELTRGVLNADTLKSLSEFLLESRRTLAEKELALNLEQRGTSEQLEQVQRERQLLTGDSARRLREAVVFVELRGEQGGQLRFGYLVSQATWSPSYNLRAGNAAQAVALEYNASIQQMSGEDWTDVAMTLSTATPSLVAKAPRLEPLAISLSQRAPNLPGLEQKQAADTRDYAAVKAELNVRRQELEKQRSQLFAQTYELSTLANQPAQQAADSPARSITADVALNGVAAEEQVLDLLCRGDLAELTRAATPRTEEVSVTYAMPMRTSLPSRADQQLVQIAALELPASLYKVAVPMLTQHVYDEATVTNSSELVLLAGPISTYHANQFVGLGEIPTVASGESFTAGLGIDASLRAKRELANKGESLQGGNRVVDFTYRLAIENFGTQPAQVRLLERMPIAKDSEVKLTLVKAGTDLSNDAGYLQAERKQGVLRWDVDVAARAVGVDAKALEYQFRLEYDKQLSIAGIPVAENNR